MPVKPDECPNDGDPAECRNDATRRDKILFIIYTLYNAGNGRRICQAAVKRNPGNKPELNK